MRIYYILLILFSSCATIGTPNGGKKDTTPPKLIKSFPQNKSINFKSKEIKLTFDENITLTKFENNISIRPKQIKEPLYFIKGKDLYIKLQDTLIPNTTYQISFKKSISDINEGNAINELTYLFSTGKYIDNGKLNGKIFNGYTGKPAQNFVVVLNKYHIDSSIFLSQPTYSTVSDEYGNFSFDGISEDQYKIFGYEDLNKDFKPSEKELFAFIDKIINVDSVTNDVKLFATEDKSLQKGELVKYFCRHYGVFEFVVSPKGSYKGLTDNNLYTEEAYLLNFDGINNDTMVWFSPSADMPDGHFDIYINDWWYRDIAILHMNNNYIRRPNYITTNIKENNKLDLFDTLAIRFHNPIWNYDDRSLEVFENNMLMQTQLNGYFIDNEKSKYLLPIKMKSNTNYTIKFKKGSFNDIFNQKLDSFIINFTSESEEKYGNLNIEYKQEKINPVFIELLDENLTPIRSNLINGPSLISYKYLKPGKYKLRAVLDINNNRKMDIGYLNKGIIPEKVYLFDDIINIKENFDLDQIQINLDNIKFIE